jgi:tetratricopeptide (TPR) repeat protein
MKVIERPVVDVLEYSFNELVSEGVRQGQPWVKEIDSRQLQETVTSPPPLSFFQNLRNFIVSLWNSFLFGRTQSQRRHLAGLHDDRESDSNELAAALGQLAALYPFVIGSTETERLRHAIGKESISHAYRRALTEGIREREPEKWFNIVAAYGVQRYFEGVTSNNVELLDQSTRALKEAVSLHPPANLKMIQVFLGQSLVALGDRQDRAELFQEAVSTFRSVLEKLPSEEPPEFRSFVLTSLGIAYQMLGIRRYRADSLREAVGTFQMALREPFDIRQWRAIINIHLGDTLFLLAEREGPRSRVADAIAAYRDALSVELDYEAMSHLRKRLAAAKRLLDERMS